MVACYSCSCSSVSVSVTVSWSQNWCKPRGSELSILYDFLWWLPVRLPVMVSSKISWYQFWFSLLAITFGHDFWSWLLVWLPVMTSYQISSYDFRFDLPHDCWLWLPVKFRYQFWFWLPVMTSGYMLIMVVKSLKFRPPGMFCLIIL